jgi:hypothetical protein
MTPRLALILPFAVLSACVPVAPLPAPVPAPVAPPAVDACGAAELQDLVGQPQGAASAITFAVPVRIIQPNSAVTMDLREDRLNVEVGADGNIARIFCG